MRGDWVLFKNKVHSMGPPGCHAGHRHQILWPEVGPFKAIGTRFYGQRWPIPRYWCQILWPVVGPSKAIRTIFYGQRWAYSMLSVPGFMASGGPIQYFMASGGPIQGHRDHILWPVVGPFKAIGTMICGPIQGHWHRIL